jgi:hypothetical protein
MDIRQFHNNLQASLLEFFPQVNSHPIIPLQSKLLWLRLYNLSCIAYPLVLPLEIIILRLIGQLLWLLVLGKGLWVRIVLTRVVVDAWRIVLA